MIFLNFFLLHCLTLGELVDGQIKGRNVRTCNEFVSVLKGNGRLLSPNPGRRPITDLIPYYLVNSCNFVNQSGVRNLLRMCHVPKL